MRALIEARVARAKHTLGTAQDARARFLSRVRGPISEKMLRLLEQPRSAAGVLLPLIERPSGMTVLFTQRSPHLKDHPGQVSFPGGRVQPGDADVTAAALREAREEIGLAPEQVSVAGLLDWQATGTGFVVTPVVGFVDADFEPVPDPSEVAAVFEVPLEFILADSSIRATYRERHGTVFQVQEMHYQGHVIWGATAAILGDFRELLLGEKT